MHLVPPTNQSVETHQDNPMRRKREVSNDFSEISSLRMRPELRAQPCRSAGRYTRGTAMIIVPVSRRCWGAKCTGTEHPRLVFDPRNRQWPGALACFTKIRCGNLRLSADRLLAGRARLYSLPMRLFVSNARSACFFHSALWRVRKWHFRFSRRFPSVHLRDITTDDSTSHQTNRRGLVGR